MKRAALVLGLMAVVVPAAADVHATLLRPAATAGWTLARSEGDYFARFSGTTSVDGTLVASWMRGVDSESPNEIQIRILLDEKSVAKLPTFTLPGSPQIRHDGELTIENVAQALRLAFPATQVASFEKRELMTLRTRASFLIENYQISLECDHQWASASLVEVNAPRLLSAGNGSFDPGC